jgi:translation initiation factor 5
LESNHKLVTFILKNPPNLNPAVQGSSLTEGKRSKRSKRTNGETNGDTSQVDDQNDTLDVSASENSGKHVSRRQPRTEHTIDLFVFVF